VIPAPSASLRLGARGAAWLAVLLTCWAAALAAPAAAAPISSHAELYICCTPYVLKDRIFAESKALGATYVRMDVELSDIFQTADGPPNWGDLDQVIALSRRYGIRVLGIMLDTPTWLSTCPLDSRPGRCPPRDFAEYGSLAGRVAAHARGAISHWQILNEPWNQRLFSGTPEDYGRILGASHDAIKAAAPEDLVVLGNTYAYGDDQAWVKRAFAAAGPGRKYEIGAVNIRGEAKDIATNLILWRRFLASQGFTGPVWVIEHGYPADTVFQFDPLYIGGGSAQARYLARSLPALERAGAAEVFLTLRYRNTNKWTDEGLDEFGDPPDYPVRRKPAFYTVRDWGNRWRSAQALYRSVASMHGRRARIESAAAADSDRRARLARRKALAARVRERSELRRADQLRGAARRNSLCFRRTRAPACRRRETRALAAVARALRRAKVARRAGRRELRAAARYLQEAQTHRRKAANHSYLALSYGRLIKPLF
jgi:hypothetical protein